jgi:hypothetical protein
MLYRNRRLSPESWLGRPEFALGHVAWPTARHLFKIAALIPLIRRSGVHEPWLKQLTAALLTLIGHLPDHSASVIRNEQTPVRGLENSHWSAKHPPITTGIRPACDKIETVAGGFSRIKRYEFHHIARSLGSVPGTVITKEGPTPKLWWKLMAGIESEIKNGHMRTEQQIGFSDFCE